MAGTWQKVYLHRITAESRTSRQNTITIDLPQKDFLSQILVRIYKTNPAYTNPLLPITHFIKKLEVVDGANVLYSLSGLQAQAFAYYRGRSQPNAERIDWESTETSDIFFIRFGRFCHDTKYMLDMNKLVNPQLKITYDNVITTVEGKTYTVNDGNLDMKYTVLLDVLRGTPAGYIGKFISAREIYTWTQSASETHYINIPRTELIYGIAVRGCDYFDLMLNNFARVRLNINNQEWIPFDIYWEEQNQLHEEWWSPKLMVACRIETADRARVPSAIGDMDGFQAITKGAPSIGVAIEGCTGGWLRPRLWVAAGGAALGDHHAVWYMHTGVFAQHTIYLPMYTIVDGGTDWLDAPSTSKIQLEITANASADSAMVPQVMVDTVRDN